MSCSSALWQLLVVHVRILRRRVAALIDDARVLALLDRAIDGVQSELG